MYNKSEIFSKQRGPVFLVGLARSGTALSRALLNNHLQLAVDPFEAKFLPLWMKNWNRYGYLGDRDNFEEFYRDTLSLGRIRKASKYNMAVIGPDVWYKLCYGFSVSEVFDALVRHDTGFEQGNAVTWVNKTPLLVRHLDLLYHHFPDAYVIHIIRDVRDAVLSQHWFTLKKMPQYQEKQYQDIWRDVCERRGRKSMIVLAQDWTDTIRKARSEAKEFKDQYLEIKYESLLEEPTNELKRICKFIGVEFIPAMTELKVPLQPGSDAKVKDRILRTNKQKYRKAIPLHILYKIEEISVDLLRDLDYELLFEWAADYTGRRLSKIERGKLRFHDYLNFLTTAIAQAGFLNGVKIVTEIALKKRRGIPKKGVGWRM